MHLNKLVRCQQKQFGREKIFGTSYLSANNFESNQDIAESFHQLFELTFLKKILTNLAFQVLMAILLGVLLGHFYPTIAVRMEIVGKTFVDIIKLFIGPIIFLTIAIGIGAIGDRAEVRCQSQGSAFGADPFSSSSKRRTMAAASP